MDWRWVRMCKGFIDCHADDSQVWMIPQKEFLSFVIPCVGYAQSFTGSPVMLALEPGKLFHYNAYCSTEKQFLFVFIWFFISRTPYNLLSNSTFLRQVAATRCLAKVIGNKVLISSIWNWISAPWQNNRLVKHWVLLQCCCSFYSYSSKANKKCWFRPAVLFLIVSLVQSDLYWLIKTWILHCSAKIIDFHD